VIASLTHINTLQTPSTVNNTFNPLASHIYAEQPTTSQHPTQNGGIGIEIII
jgi:hypothetical protein